MMYVAIFIAYLSVLYILIGTNRIVDKLIMYFDRTYWTDYNIIELCAWMAKAAIIIPGLIFGLELWWLHLITLITSSLLIWASMRKSLPTLIVFNTLWICISLTIIIRHLLL